MRSVRVPSALEGGAITRACKTFETCLSAEVLITQLRSKVDLFISRIERVDSIVLAKQRNRVVLVDAVSTKGTRLAIRPKVLVSTAGEGNQVVLIFCNGQRPWPDADKDLQQVRRSFMLIVKGKRGDLAPLTGVFPDLDANGRFSRKRWSSHLAGVGLPRPRKRSESDRKKYDAHWWVPKIVALLLRSWRRSIVRTPIE